MIKLISPDVTEYYDAEFAVMLSRLIGYHEPLIDRLRNHQGHPAQDDYFASVLADPDHKWPTSSQVEMRREHLHRAVVFLWFLWKDGRRGGMMEAYDHVCTEHEIDLKTARNSVKYARGLGDGEWWNPVERLAKKRKGESIRLTY
jgi:hypothetical protein